jgi:hypothetical protein
LRRPGAGSETHPIIPFAEENHWRQYNRECHREYGRPVYADLRLETFNHDGTRRARTDIMAALAVLLR